MLLCNLKASNETAMMIEVFQGLDIIWLVSSVSTVQVFKKGSQISNFCVTYIYLSISSLSIFLTHKSLNFHNLSLELDNVPIFRQESNTSGILSLYSVRKCVKLEGPALEMQSSHTQLESSFELTNKTNKEHILLITYKVHGLHIIQYYNIHKIAILQGTGNNNNNNNNNKNYKIYLYRAPCTLCGKMTHKENLEMS